MKLKDLIESAAEATKTKSKIKSKLIRRRRPKSSYPFTRLVIMIFEANVKYDLDEAIAYMPKSFKGKSGNHFDYKVEIMIEYLNEATIELDNYVKRMPNLMDLDKIHFSSNLKKLVKELNKVVSIVQENHQEYIDVIKSSLSRFIEKEILTQKKINDLNYQYKKITNEIKTFNAMIDYLHKFFNTEVKDKSAQTILYNPDELKYKRLINETLSLKLGLIEIDIPKEPIYTPDDIDEGLSIRPEDREEAKN